MMENSFRLLVICVLILIALPNIFAQSGGTYQITQSVLSSGEKSVGGAYSVENTSGQPIAGGFVQGSPYSLYSGFWTPPTFAPTAANVSISGCVTTANGQGIRNVQIILTDSLGTIRNAQTVTFGFYRFADVRAGESYVLTILSKRYLFSNPTRVLNVQEELTDVNFVADN